MGFSAKQVKALRRNLDHRYVRTREINGRALSYIEGWYAISEANRIFGFDGWSRETTDSRCVLTRENRGSFLAVYTARVRISVQADGTTVIREGHGTGEGRGNSPGEVHDTALKAAETDATKRALATFGKPFGLALYRSGNPVSALAVPTFQVLPSSSRTTVRISSRRHNANTAPIAFLRPAAASTDNGTAASAKCTPARPRRSQPELRSHRQKPTCHRRTKTAA